MKKLIRSSQLLFIESSKSIGALAEPKFYSNADRKLLIQTIFTDLIAISNAVTVPIIFYILQMEPYKNLLVIRYEVGFKLFNEICIQVKNSSPSFCLRDIQNPSEGLGLNHFFSTNEDTEEKCFNQ